MLEAIEAELQRVVNDADQSRADGLYPILAYHMGWQGDGAGKQAMGKRIRPLLLLLTCAAAGGDWENALPAAAAVELIHNFSLIHDDIEDNSPLRRGRPTVWNKWGVPLAINAGDAMFTLAHLSILRLKDTVGANKALEGAIILQNTCLDLTKGQHLDMTYETQQDLSLDDYWLMVSGKTASLISACCELGAITASTTQVIQSKYKDFGYNLGMAFQALDDVLGIWGEVETTGKSAESDLVSGKKSLPIIYALSQDGSFADRWRRGSVKPQEVPELARQLEIEGARDYTQESAACFTDKALTALASAEPTGEAGQLLSELADQLLKRKL
jgi:geranylgeranyl diphosphate synthase type I